jgi:hypothetical protein
MLASEMLPKLSQQCNHPHKAHPACLLPPKQLRCRCRCWPPAAWCSAWWMRSAAAQTRWVAVPGLRSCLPLVQPCLVRLPAYNLSPLRVSTNIAPPCLPAAVAGAGAGRRGPACRRQCCRRRLQPPGGSRCRQGSSGGGLPRHQDQEGSGGLSAAAQDYLQQQLLCLWG